MPKPIKPRKSRAKHPGSLPKGAYRRPDGTFVTRTTGVTTSGRRISVRSVRYEQPDILRLARTFLQIAESLHLEDNDPVDRVAR